MSNLWASMTEEELAPYNLSAEQLQSYRRFQLTWNDFNLPEPFVTCFLDDDNDSKPEITASWMRYDIIVHIESSGSWLVMDLSKSYQSDSSVPAGTSNWCSILASRIPMISPGGGVSDMKDRGVAPWR